MRNVGQLGNENGKHFLCSTAKGLLLAFAKVINGSEMKSVWGYAKVYEKKQRDTAAILR